MNYIDHRIAFKRAVMDVFLNWHKTSDEQAADLTAACIIAGIDPNDRAKRERLFGEIMACRRGQYQWEMPHIMALVERYIPSPIGRVINAISKIFS